jgi:serine/threonine protein kinase
VCKGLGAAHAAGIVHRDIKPENILLVEEDGRAGMVKIVDFGVATILGGEGGSQIAGTPQYMAPEQIAGGDFDGRVDMYALGCTAYEMMVGHPPFDGDSLEQVLMGHIQEAPRPPREAAPDRSLPAELEAVVMRCLAKEPGDRYTDMADLEAALCEAQVAAGLTSAWDDLPLPDVAPERRAAIAALWVRRDRELEAPRRRWLWPLVAGLAGVYLGRRDADGGEPRADRGRAQRGRPGGDRGAGGGGERSLGDLG